MMDQDGSSATSTTRVFAQEPSSSNPNVASTTKPKKRKRSRRGNAAGPEAEVISLSPRSLLETHKYICETCHKGFARDQNLQLHRRCHNLPWKLKPKATKDQRKKVYVCPERTCVHHNPTRALGDLTGIKKHYSRKHGEKRWQCKKCAKMYAVHSDWKAHVKICGTREYRCDCGALFSRKDSFITHTAFCDSLDQDTAYSHTIQAVTANSSQENEFLNNGTMTTTTHTQATVIPKNLRAKDFVENLKSDMQNRSIQHEQLLPGCSNQGHSTKFNPLGVTPRNSSNTFLASSTTASNLSQLNQGVQMHIFDDSTLVQAQRVTPQLSSKYTGGNLFVSPAALPRVSRHEDQNNVNLSFAMQASLAASSSRDNVEYQCRVISNFDTATGFVHNALPSSLGYSTTPLGLANSSICNSFQNCVTYGNDQFNTAFNPTSQPEANLHEFMMNLASAGPSMWNNPYDIRCYHMQVTNSLKQASQAECNSSDIQRSSYDGNPYNSLFNQTSEVGMILDEVMKDRVSSVSALGSDILEGQFLDAPTSNLCSDHNVNLVDLMMPVDELSHGNQSNDPGAVNTCGMQPQTIDSLGVENETRMPLMYNELEAIVSGVNVSQQNAQK